MGKYYDNTDPKLYDEMIKRINSVTEYNAVIKAVIEFLKDPPRDTTIIIDIGCGTGLIGQRLTENGFTEIVG